MKKYDFYDYEEAEKFRIERSEKLMNLVRRWHRAKEKGDEEAKLKAVKAIVKHKEANEQYKKYAEESGFYWH